MNVQQTNKPKFTENSIIRLYTIGTLIFNISLLVMFILYFTSEPNNYTFTVIAGVIAGISLTYTMGTLFVVNPETFDDKSIIKLNIILIIIIGFLFISILAYSGSRKNLDDDELEKGDLGINSAGMGVGVVLVLLTITKMIFPKF